MRLKFHQLATRLRQDLSPIFVIAGEEPLQRGEAVDLVRAATKAAGYTERLRLDVGAGFDWDALHEASANLSLFAEKRVVELHIVENKPGVVGSKALMRYAGAPPPDTVLLVVMGKVDRATTGGAWFKSLDKIGVVVQVWPLSESEVEGWVAARLKAVGIVAEQEAVRLLASRGEGNLLAARQEIEKLSLSFGQGRLDVGQLRDAVAESARFTVFDLGDAVLEGDTTRAVRILEALREEGVASLLVLWSVTEQIRTLASMTRRLSRGESPQQVIQGVWVKRRALASKALRRYPEAIWNRLLRHCAAVDRVVKGAEPGNEWEDLLELAVAGCGGDGAQAVLSGLARRYGPPRGYA